MSALIKNDASAVEPTLVISGSWVWAETAGTLQMLKDHDVVIVGDRIEHITPNYAGPVDKRIDASGQLVMPGLMNMHTHADPKLHGTTIDVRLSRLAKSPSPAADLVDTAFLYSIFFPLGNALRGLLSEDEKASLLQLGLMGLVRGGATTIVEQCTLGARHFAEAALGLGARVYVGDTISSLTGMPELRADGTIAYEENTEDPFSGLERTLQLHKLYHGAGNGRIQIMFAPHATDTCSPDLLRAIRAAADEHQIGIMMHVAQSEPEVDRVQELFGTSPVKYLAGLGILGPDFLAAHCIFTDREDRNLLRESGTTVVHCPTSFAKGGMVAPYAPYRDAGVNLAIGTDSFAVDLLVELRTAAMLAKAVAGSPWVASTSEMIGHATVDAAKALRRQDLGRLAEGAKADVITVDLSGVHNAPVLDPLRKAVHLSNINDVRNVVIDGKVVVSDGEFTTIDEREVLKKAEPIFQFIWKTAIDQGLITE